MPRKSQDNPGFTLPGDAATWFTHKKVKRSAVGSRKGSIPPARQEVGYLDAPSSLMPDPRKRKKVCKLRDCPPYLASIGTVNLSADDWRQLMVFFLRRLYRRDPELSEQFAWDIRVFEGHRARKVKDPSWIQSALEMDEPIAKHPTPDEELSYMWIQWYTQLLATPPWKWPGLCKRFTYETKSLLEQALRTAAMGRKDESRIALELTAIQRNPQKPNPASVRAQLSRHGFAPWVKVRRGE
jgi:hypothetical protein